MIHIRWKNINVGKKVQFLLICRNFEGNCQMKYSILGTAIECLSIPIILHKEPGDDKVIWNEGCMIFELEFLYG